MLILLIISCFYNCNNDNKHEITETGVKVTFTLGSGDFTCGEYCGTTINVENKSELFKAKYDLPETITSKTNWWNKEYIATIKYLDEVCDCKNGDIEPPIGVDNWESPTGTLAIIEILSIEEK